MLNEIIENADFSDGASLFTDGANLYSADILDFAKIDTIYIDIPNLEDCEYTDELAIHIFANDKCDGYAILSQYRLAHLEEKVGTIANSYVTKDCPFKEHGFYMNGLYYKTDIEAYCMGDEPELTNIIIRCETFKHNRETGSLEPVEQLAKEDISL